MIQLKIEGMTCNHCVMAVKQALGSVAGAQDVQVDLKAGAATVGGSPDLQALVAAVAEEGFTARLAH